MQVATGTAPFALAATGRFFGPEAVSKSATFSKASSTITRNKRIRGNPFGKARTHNFASSMPPSR